MITLPHRSCYIKGSIIMTHAPYIYIIIKRAQQEQRMCRRQANMMDGNIIRCIHDYNNKSYSGMMRGLLYIVAWMMRLA